MRGRGYILRSSDESPLRTYGSKVADGFTIVELLIATSVFSVVLLLSLTGFLQIGQLFYKGVSTTQTNESARKIVDSLAADVYLSSTLTSSRNSTNNAKWLCMGASRYTYKLGNKVDLSNHGNTSTASNFALLKDTVAVGTCPNPDPAAPGVALNNAIEMLADNTRLSDLQIASQPSSPNLFYISTIVAFGSDQVLTNPATTSVACDTNLKTSQFCSVAKLSTYARKGL